MSSKFIINYRIRGSDASWLNDVEPPSHQLDYSDDEEERRANRARKESKQKHEDSDGETSRQNPRKMAEPRRNQRPSESSSRFGSGPSRGRNPFSAGSRRNNPNSFTRFARPWGNFDMRTPPPHPNDPNQPPFSASPNFPSGPPIFPPPFNPSTPPPFMGNTFHFRANPRMGGPMNMPPFRQNVPIFGSPYCNSGPPQWVNGPPPPPGT